MRIDTEFENEVQFGELKEGEPFRKRRLEGILDDHEGLCMKIEKFAGDGRRFNYVTLKDGYLRFADDCEYCQRADAVITEKK